MPHFKRYKNCECDVTDPQNKKERRAESQQLMTLPDGKTISDILGEEKMTIGYFPKISFGDVFFVYLQRVSSKNQ